MERRSGVAMIPTKRNRLIQLPVDPAIYALRNMVERCFNKLKNARKLATRYDKTADNYLGFIHIVSVRLLLRQFVNAFLSVSRSFIPKSRGFNDSSRGVIMRIVRRLYATRIF